MEVFTATPFWIGKDTQGLLPLLERLFEELERRYIGYQDAVGLLLPQLLIGTIRNYEQRQLSQTAFVQGNRSESQSVVIEEYFLYEYNDLSLGGLAGRLKLSPRQTQRLLTGYYGKSFQQKKTEARMSAAAILLSEKGRSVASAAEALGYSSAEHFSSAFHKYYGISPREYRRQLTQETSGDGG